MATSNHIHLLVFDGGGRDVIPKSMQLIDGRTGQEYNQRKMRKGAFSEDRYHATAVERGNHLLECLVYIDLNVEASVSSGVTILVWVSGPRAWLPAPLNAVPDLTGVGSKDVVESAKLRPCIHAQGRKVSETKSAYQLREPQAPYSDDFAPEKEALRVENTYFGNIYPNISMQ